MGANCVRTVVPTNYPTGACYHACKLAVDGKNSQFKPRQVPRSSGQASLTSPLGTKAWHILSPQHLHLTLTVVWHRHSRHPQLAPLASASMLSALVSALVSASALVATVETMYSRYAP